MEISLGEGVSAIPAAEWDACAGSDNPFTSHRFLTALERSGSVGEGTGWLPRPMVLREAGEVLAVAPLYLKLHSQGEYIFDHAWADAFERAGGSYYPKLQVAVPFTPATGPRLLVRPGHEARGRAALLQGLEAVAAQKGLSSAHVTFCTPGEAQSARAPWLSRMGEQFHWQNAGYGSYEDFLAQLSSRKRKALRKERAAAKDFGGRILHLSGADLQPEHWAAFWDFYQDTGARKWGRPYLTRAFFDEIHATMADDILLILAEREGRYVAGALNFIGRDTLYGRYWGAVEEHPFLHFELCYHQAIDFAIARGLSRVEAGAQGEHKLARGYLPVPVWSLHHLPDQGFRRAVAAYLKGEAEAISEDIAALTDLGPFRRDQPI
ncbi:GNAT family N-acetyltransferase [Falsigemmobacter faecalis]|uniref:N-acetyltransferase n=1 Tax=Falsigemmobacter faecalis TaxID=2488730 RepID=A0A3P3DJS2_9RHOB|nr:GNAT family N-acetyltransferase [Falsigemmobacter faecalis]RRH73956.1 N-acetyltransferase [Falsigemmobacter faecalis]